MITDSELNGVAIFMGSLAMLLIVVYHFLEVNAKPDAESDPLSDERKRDVGAVSVATASS